MSRLFSRFIPLFLIFTCLLPGQLEYNHPELEWYTIETEHFQIHYYDATEGTAREGATVAEMIYPHITELYGHEPDEKTDLVFLDIDDFTNGFAFYYDNKIYIWATPLDFNLRGSHRWLQNVITHEFAHIVSLQAAMKAGRKFPGAYVQFMGYEREKRKDVLYGYPNRIISYPIPGTVVPPWLAEGVAQFSYPGADWDLWDSHRDMLLRDRVLHGEMLTLAEMNTFGKKGNGNESIYNSGFAFTRYIATEYGSDKLRQLMRELSRPLQFSINGAIKNVLGVSSRDLFSDFKQLIEKRYNTLTESVVENEYTGKIIAGEGSANLFPVWNHAGTKFAYLSNRGNDYMSQTNLYIYDMKTESDKLISRGVKHAATWAPGDDKIYYSKTSFLPNKYGSSFYDLYEYDFESEKAKRLTENSRAYAPVYISSDSALAYVASADGTQNLYYFHLGDHSVEQLTDFDDRRSVYGLHFNENENRIYFDYSAHHFRNIGYLDLGDSIIGDYISNDMWDERNMATSGQGEIIYSEDRTGIYNLYLIDPASDRQGYITNVTGGAFMADISRDGKIVYSLYDELGYKIALIDSFQFQEQEDVGYFSEFYLRNSSLADPVMELDAAEPEPYKDNFTTMFILPKLMWEYGTFKPGMYFYSSEVLNRLSIFGQASMNRDSDLDLFLLFELKRFYPTLYTEIIYMTRNRQERNYYSVYPIDDNLKFRLVQFSGGARMPLLSITNLDLFVSWQRYRTFIKEKVDYMGGVEQGIAYDYFQGTHLGLRWNGNMIKGRADSNINPSKGFKYNLALTYEKNDFINGLNLSDTGTLIAGYTPNNLTRVEFDGSYHLEIPKTRRWTLSFETIAGWHNNVEADSFFNFFAGGLPGIQGYSFYSIEGNRTVVGEVTLRIPLLYLKSFPIGWFNLNSSTIGLVGQAGDAWSAPAGKFDMKKSLGLQLRFNGFSFYNYPTAIGLEVHYGLDKFERVINSKTFHYGKEPRFYASILFGF